jgi:hypothetical protein
MPQLTYRLTCDDPEIYRVSFDGKEIGAIALRTRHVMPIITYWHWGVGILPMMSNGGRPPEGDIEPPGRLRRRAKGIQGSLHAMACRYPG